MQMQEIFFSICHSLNSRSVFQEDWFWSFLKYAKKIEEFHAFNSYN